jgi:hypothetical protein
MKSEQTIWHLIIPPLYTLQYTLKRPPEFCTIVISSYKNALVKWRRVTTKKNISFLFHSIYLIWVYFILFFFTLVFSFICAVITIVR